MSKKLVSFPDGAQDYLRDKYGIRPYSGRHLNDLVKQKKFPAPIQVSARRRAILTDILDEHAARIISGAGSEIA